MTRYLPLKLSLLLLIPTLLFLRSAAQGDTVACPALEPLYIAASEACLGRGDGQVCNGGSAPGAVPAETMSALADLGALVSVSELDALRTPGFNTDASAGGISWLRVPEVGIDALLVGDTTVRDKTPPNFPAWQAIIVQTAPTPDTCETAPRSTFAVQNRTPGQAARVVINGFSLELDGTVLVQTDNDATVFIALEGRVRVLAASEAQVVEAGQQTRGSHAADHARALGPPERPTPFEPERVAHFPIELLDDPTLMPQPGFVSTVGAVNLRSGPSTDAGVIVQVPAGQSMTVLGRTPDSSWYHVRTRNGFTGWMFSDLLRHNHGPISAVYTSTPAPPQRFGDVGRKAQVLATAGVNLRTAPYLIYDAIMTLEEGTEVDLIARSPYNAWVKVEAAGMQGWVALLALETQAIISALPMDYDIPLPPEPTRVPGSWGGAFPDPDCYPNC
jgi:uncharacterized protein YgiM (DUF1202 family)